MRVSGLALSTAILFAPALATAAPNRQACVAAYEETQTSMRRSQLTHARDTLQVCLDQACPAVLRADCAGWLKEIEARMPTVVVEVTQDGGAVKDAKLLVDDKVHAPGVDGRAMDIDPGAHVFRIEMSDGTHAMVDALVREGEKLKVVRIELPSKKPAAPPTPVIAPPVPVTAPLPPPPAITTEERRPVPWTVWTAAGIGAAAAIGFSIFAISGTSAKGDLDGCKPDCTSDRIDSVHTRFVVADVFLGVSVVALGAATILYLTRPTVTTTR